MSLVGAKKYSKDFNGICKTLKTIKTRENLNKAQEDLIKELITAPKYKNNRHTEKIYQHVKIEDVARNRNTVGDAIGSIENSLSKSNAMELNNEVKPQNKNSDKNGNQLK